MRDVKVNGAASDALHRYLSLVNQPPSMGAEDYPTSFLSHVTRGQPINLPLHPSHPWQVSLKEAGIPALGALFSMSARFSRVRRWHDHHSLNALLKPIASGGGLHPTEIYVFHRGIADLKDGVSWYDPLHHQLRYVNEMKTEECNHSPKLLLWLAARSERVCTRYQNFSLRLQTLDAGILAEHLVLIANYLRLQVCISNLGDHDSYSTWTGNDPIAVPLLLEIELICDTQHYINNSHPQIKDPFKQSNSSSSTSSFVSNRDFPAVERLISLAFNEEDLVTSLRLPTEKSMLDEKAPQLSRIRKSSLQGFYSCAIDYESIHNIIFQLPNSLLREQKIILVARDISGISQGIYEWEDVSKTWCIHKSVNSEILMLGGKSDYHPQSNHPAAWLYLIYRHNHSPIRFLSEQVRLGQTLHHLQLLCQLENLDCYMSLAYNVQEVACALGEDDDSYIGAQLLIGKAQKNNSFLDIMLPI